MKPSAIVLFISLIGTMLFGANGLAAVDLGAGTYTYDIAAGAYDVTTISFDFEFGTLLGSPSAAFRIRRLNDDNTDSWLGSFNIHSASFNLDTDYGPYSVNQTLTGSNHYEFTLNRANGLWDLTVNGLALDFVSLSSTTDPQPDGTTGFATGDPMLAKYFSDESLASAQNAVDLGWAEWNSTNTGLIGDAADGVGGTGAYRLIFLGAEGGSVDNITVSNVPEPATVVIWGLLGLTATGFGLWRRRRAA